MQPPKSSFVDVLVVGAGPSGAMVAYSLVKAGISVKIIDKKSVPVDRGHADALQPRVLEVLRSHGLIDKALETGNKINTTSIWHPGPHGHIQRTSRIPNITAPRGLYPFNLTNHQGATEGLFTNAMESMGVYVQRSVQPYSLTLQTEDKENPEAYPVIVEIESCTSPGKTEIVHAKYVVGADGAHSWVRKSLNITQTGDRTEKRWGVIDFVPDTDFPDIRATSQVHSNTGFCLIVPREGDMARFYVPFDENPQCMDHNGDRNVHPDEILKIVQKTFAPYRMNVKGDYHWHTVYIVGQRVADTFSASNRVFLSGDACHTHSPKAGQGMNAGINDAHNLAWKLIYLLRGWAIPKLLDTYESERRQFALDLINFDKKYVSMFEKMAHGPTKVTTKTGAIVQVDDVDPDAHSNTVKAFGQFKNGIGIQYGDSMIVTNKNQSLAKNITIGRRFPPEIILCAGDDRVVQIHDLLPSNTKFKVLIFGGDLASPGHTDKLAHLANVLSKSTLLAKKRLPSGASMTMVETMTILQGRKGQVLYTDVPEVLRSHWSRVFVDDVDITGEQGGKAYESFGISSEGAVVVVRPDGYVGTVTPLSDSDGILNYFGSWATAF